MPISGLRGELDQKQASSATSSSCPADAGQMPCSCSAGSLGHWEPGRHGIQPHFLLNSMKWSDPWARHGERPGRQPRPSPPPLLYSLSWASFSPGSSVAAVSPELPLVTRPLSVEESLGPLRAHRELSPVAKATKSPTWLQASPWTVGGGEAWRGLLEMETRSPFSRALGKDVSLASLLCILF